MGSAKTTEGGPGGKRRRRDLAAGATSVVLHLLAVIVIFGSASGAVVSGGGARGDDGAAMTVTLVSADTLGLGSEAGGGASTLTQRQTTADHPIFAPQPRDPQLDAVLQGLRAKSTATPGSRAGGTPRTAGPKSLTPTDPDALAKLDQALRGPSTGTQSTGDLWGQIEPCWRRLGGDTRTPVTLEVALDAAGRLRIPPKVIREPGVPVAEQRLRAEAGALAALAACLPRNDLRFAGAVYRLDFGSTR